jgi:hypothetical protein
VVFARKIPFEWVMRAVILGRHESIDAQKALRDRPRQRSDEARRAARPRDRAGDEVASNSPAAVQTGDRHVGDAGAAAQRRSPRPCDGAVRCAAVRTR